MSTSALYRAIGMNGYEHQAAWEEHGRFKLRARVATSRLRCPGCGSTNVVRRGRVDRMLHAPPIGLRCTVMFIETPRLECRACRTVRTVPLPGVPAGKNHTTSFARLVIDLRKMMTIQDVH